MARLDMRGRVGRGSERSSCLLLYQAPLGETAKARLSILRETDDGFRIAESDLEIRGPGDFFGTRQWGMPSFRVAHLVRDRELVEVARIRSKDMAARGYFSHNPPDGCNFVCIMDRGGVGHAWAGENIAWNNWDWDQSADRAVAMWENSPPHLKNILNCHYTRMGIST